MKDIRDKKRILIGIGNSGRSDDGLGWSFVEDIESSGFGGDVFQRYQLQIEDAELISHYDEVIFVDACHDNLAVGYEMRPCFPANEFSFTTHELSPETILFLCKDLYQKEPETKILVIEGKNWELEIGLSDLAKMNLEKAVKGFKETFQSKLVEIID